MIKIAICQLIGSQAKDLAENKGTRKAEAEKFIRQAADNGAQIVALPEMWLCPFGGHRFMEFAEEDGGETYQFMSALAKELGIYLVGGSIPEKSEDGTKVYNTNYTFDPAGKLIAKHRKVHLFDIFVKEVVAEDGTVLRKGMTYKESDDFESGDKYTICEMTIDGQTIKVGIAICFDIRFVEMFVKMADKGAQVTFLPASFNQTTGPVHWDLSLRSAAVFSQMYVLGCAPAFDPDSSYKSYSRSAVYDPWGDVVAHAEDKNEILYAEIDPNYVGKIRDELPILSARKPEVYR